MYIPLLRPDSQQAPDVHQLGHVIRIVVGQQQGFAQDGLAVSPGNARIEVCFRIGDQVLHGLEVLRNFLMLAFHAAELGGASLRGQ